MIIEIDTIQHFDGERAYRVQRLFCDAIESYGAPDPRVHSEGVEVTMRSGARYVAIGETMDSFHTRLHAARGGMHLQVHKLGDAERAPIIERCQEKTRNPFEALTREDVETADRLRKNAQKQTKKQ